MNTFHVRTTLVDVSELNSRSLISQQLTKVRRSRGQMRAQKWPKGPFVKAQKGPLILLQSTISQSHWHFPRFDLTPTAANSVICTPPRPPPTCNPIPLSQLLRRHSRSRTFRNSFLFISVLCLILPLLSFFISVLCLSLFRCCGSKRVFDPHLSSVYSLPVLRGKYGVFQFISIL